METAVSPQTPTTPTPPAVPGYELIQSLGEGGMGVVWKARQLRLNRTVAVKLAYGGQPVGPTGAARFLTEAEAIAAVRHPNVVQVFEGGETDGRAFLAMEYLPGGSLADRLKRTGKLPPAEAAALLGKVARGWRRPTPKGSSTGT